jgi:hypothetical protein
MSATLLLILFLIGYALGRHHRVWRERERFMNWQDNLERSHDRASGGQRRRAGDRKKA